MKKFITTILLVGVAWMVFNNSNIFANGNLTLNSFQSQTKADEETNEAFKKTKVINTSGNYLVLENGETVRLSSIDKITDNGNKFIYNSLLNRTVWLYHDGEDESNVNCVYVFISKPGRVLKIEDSFNRILVSKCVANSGVISDGNYKNALRVYPTYPISY